MTSLGAAAIHFAVLGEHFDEYVPFGVFFIIVAWSQAIWAVWIVAAPSRQLFVAGLLGNLVVIAVWIVSRTAGIPVGPDAGLPEAAALSDVVATVLEVVIVFGCVALLFTGDRMRRGQFTARSSFAVAGALAIVAAGVSTAAAVSGSRQHHDSDAPAQNAEHHDSHEMVADPGEPDPDQIEFIRAAMAEYEDMEIALAEGWEQEHPDWPGTGAHFYRGSDWVESGPARPQLDPVDPEFLMYSRLRTGEWELVAVAYVVDQALYPDPPTELQGAVYHGHVWTCVVDGEELEEDDYGAISREECQAMDGDWSPGGVWMTHVWFIDNPAGVFAEENPELV